MIDLSEEARTSKLSGKTEIRLAEEDLIGSSQPNIIHSAREGQSLETLSMQEGPMLSEAPCRKKKGEQTRTKKLNHEDCR